MRGLVVMVTQLGLVQCLDPTIELNGLGTALLEYPGKSSNIDWCHRVPLIHRVIGCIARLVVGLVENVPEGNSPHGSVAIGIKTPGGKIRLKLGVILLIAKRINAEETIHLPKSHVRKNAEMAFLVANIECKSAMKKCMPIIACLIAGFGMGLASVKPLKSLMLIAVGWDAGKDTAFNAIKPNQKSVDVVAALGADYERSNQFRLAQYQGYEFIYLDASRSRCAYFLRWVNGVDLVYVVGFDAADTAIFKASGKS